MLLKKWYWGEMLGYPPTPRLMQPFWSLPVHGPAPSHASPPPTPRLLSVLAPHASALSVFHTPVPSLASVFSPLPCYCLLQGRCPFSDACTPGSCILPGACPLQSSCPSQALYTPSQAPVSSQAPVELSPPTPRLFPLP